MFNNYSSLLALSLALTLTAAPCHVYAADEDAQPASESDRLSEAELQQLFETAMAERDSGKVFSAIQKFEYILSRRPSLNRARLELAVSYHRASRYEDALKEFQTVLNDPGTPEKVRLAILAYLGQLTSDELKPAAENLFSYYAKAGAIYNTNINFAPLRGSQIYQIPDGEDTASPGLDTFISASHRYARKKPLNTAGAATEFEWQSQLSWTGNNYTRTSDFNLNIISLSTGPALISTGRWRGSLTIQVDQTYFGSHTLGTLISLNPLLTFDLGNYRGITLEASYSDIQYAQAADNGRDGSSTLLGAAFSTLLNGVDDGLEVGFRLLDRPADDEQFGYNSYELYFGGFMATGPAANVYLNINLQQYNFNAADTVSGTTRDELESRFVLGYNFDFAEGYLQGWTMNTNASFSKNNSNVDAFSYERIIVGVNLARYFQ